MSEAKENPPISRRAFLGTAAAVGAAALTAKVANTPDTIDTRSIDRDPKTIANIADVRSTLAELAHYYVNLPPQHHNPSGNTREVEVLRAIDRAYYPTLNAKTIDALKDTELNMIIVALKEVSSDLSRHANQTVSNISNDTPETKLNWLSPELQEAVKNTQGKRPDEEPLSASNIKNSIDILALKLMPIAENMGRDDIAHSLYKISEMPAVPESHAPKPAFLEKVLQANDSGDERTLVPSR